MPLLHNLFPDPVMSILEKLKSASNRKLSRLLENHPLASESLELRLQYLAAVALVTAIDRQPSDAERMAFIALADSLAVGGDDAQEQLAERASVTEDDILLLFDVLRTRNAGPLYLLDLAWIHSAGEAFDDNERAVTEHLATLLEMDAQEVADLHGFALALRRKKASGMYPLLPRLLRKQALQELLPPLIGSCMPFAGILADRWIDNGNQTVTDSESGLTWTRCTLGLELSDGKIKGKAKIIECHDSGLDEHADSIRRIVAEFTETIRDSTWRLPSATELAAISDKSHKLDYSVFKYQAPGPDGKSQVKSGCKLVCLNEGGKYTLFKPILPEESSLLGSALLFWGVTTERAEILLCKGAGE